MAGNYLSNPSTQWMDDNGDPLSGGTLDFFEAGGTSVRLDTFTDKDLTGGNENVNPIILDSDGRSPTAIFLQQLSYNIVVKNSAGSVQTNASRDNISNILQVDVTGVPEADTYAALTALVKATLTDLSVFQVNGRTTKGDIQPVSFQWNVSSSASANAGTILASDEGGTGRWLMLINGPFLAEWFNAKRDGTTDDTTAIQAAFDAAAGGEFKFLAGTYLHDSLLPSSNTKITGAGMGATILKFIPHATNDNVGIECGDGVAGVENVLLQDFAMDGQKAVQTGVGDEFSHCIRISASNDCIVNRVKMFDPQGDGYYVGIISGRITDSADGNTIEDCEIFGQTRQAITATFANELMISKNRISGTIDIEINVGNFENKNIQILGNRGRVQTEDLTGQRLSDLKISTATLETDGRKTSGIIIANNTCFKIQGTFNDGVQVLGNTIIGSETTENFLLDFAGCDNMVISGNSMFANTGVATALTEILRTRACSDIVVTNNQIDNETLPFHLFLSGFGGEPAATNQYFYGNNLKGSGTYRAANPESASEYGKFRLDVTAGTLTITQLAGVPITGIVTNSSNDVVFGQFGFAGATYVLKFDNECSITNADASTLDTLFYAKIVSSGGNRTITGFSAAAATGAVSLSAVAFSSVTGSFFFEVWV